MNTCPHCNRSAVRFFRACRSAGQSDCIVARCSPAPSTARVGIGAALGDGLFACITGFGFTALVQLIVGYRDLLQLVGGLLLLFFGIRTFYTPPPRFDERLVANENGTSSYVRAMASTFALTISNPATLFGLQPFLPPLADLRREPQLLLRLLRRAGRVRRFDAVVADADDGRRLLHARISDRTIRLINEISGGMIALFGVIVLGHLVVHLLSK